MVRESNSILVSPVLYIVMQAGINRTDNISRVSVVTSPANSARITLTLIESILVVLDKVCVERISVTNSPVPWPDPQDGHS